MVFKFKPHEILQVILKLENVKKGLLILILFFVSKTYSQDPVFTQFYNVPEYLNPSFTGGGEGSQIGIINRSQWFGLNYGLNSQFFYFDSFLENINSGIGISILNHHESITRYNFTQVNLNYAYHVQLSDGWYFFPSISAGFGIKDYAFDNLLLEDQILISQGIINVNTDDPFMFNENVSFFDTTAGLLFFNENFWFGGSFKHMTSPNISFQNEGGQVKLEKFYSIHGGYKQPLRTRYVRDDFNLYFNLNYMRQAKFDRVDIGSLVEYNAISLGATASIVPTDISGGSHKLTSVNLLANIDFGGFTFGYSYDLNVSSLQNTKGIFEISISYNFASIFGKGPIPCGCK